MLLQKRSFQMLIPIVSLPGEGDCDEKPKVTENFETGQDADCTDM